MQSLRLYVRLCALGSIMQWDHTRWTKKKPRSSFRKKKQYTFNPKGYKDFLEGK